MEPLYTNLLAFFAWLLKTTLQGSLLIGLILLIKLAFRNRLPAKWHYGLWLSLLVRLSLPWAPPSRLSVHNVLPLSRWMDGAVASAPATLGETSTPLRATSPGVSYENVRPKGAEPPPSATLTLPSDTPRVRLPSGAARPAIIWMVGAGLLAGYVLARSLRLWWAIRRERPVTNPEILDLLEDGKMHMGVRTIVGVIVTDKVRTPALFGFVRPRLLLPQGLLESLSLDELHYVILHELAHLRRRDIFIGWWAALLQVLHWFNPLVWFALRRMRADQEIACDALVLSHMKPEEPPAYGRTVLRLLQRTSRPQYLPSVAGILEDASQLERRITMIGQYKQHSPRMAVVAGLTFALLAATTLTNARPARVDVLDEKVPVGLQRNLLMYYSFDRDGGTRAVDISGMDFHGAIQGAEYIEDGYRGGAMRFDGEGDFIQVGPEVSLKAFTVAAWVRTQTTSLNNRRLFLLDAEGDYWALQGTARGRDVELSGPAFEEDEQVPMENRAFETDAWIHVAATFNGDRFAVYKDGRLLRFGHNPRSGITGTLYVGGTQSYRGGHWYGTIDELAVFNRALTDSEVEQLHEMAGEQVERQPTMRSVEGGAGPIAMWRFDGDARDSVGNRYGVVHGATPTAGVSGQAYAFDGQDDHVVIRNVQLHSFSVAAWVRTETTSINNRQIFVLTNGVRGYSLQGNVGGGVGVDVAAEGEVNEYHWQFAVGRWTHLVLAHDGKTFRIFKDGVLTQEGSLSTEGVRGTVFIGGSDHMDRGYWNGAIDEVVVWDRPLSQSEVKRLFDSYPLVSERTALSRVLQPNDFGGRWLGIATDKPEDGNSRDGLALELETDAANRVTGLAAGDFVDSETQRIENGRIQGGRLEFEIRHRTGVRMHIWLELRDGTLQGEGLPIDSDEDRCDIRLERTERRPTRLTGRPRERL